MNNNGKLTVITVPQAWKDFIRRSISEYVGVILDSGFSDGSTSYSFVVATKLKPTKIQKLLWNKGLHYVRVERRFFE